MRHVIAKLGTPNKNGMVYSRSCFEKFAGLSVPVYLDNDRQLSAVAGSAKIEVSDDSVSADVSVLKTPAGEKLSQFLELSNVEFRTMGVGSVEKSGEVSNYDLQG